MQSPFEAKIRNGEFSRSIDMRRDLGELQDHLKEVTEGEAFRGSQRSAQFLKYVVEHALAGDFDSLKERSIGMQLFGRAPTYDTGADAIVRVTASDVRKRLHSHYNSAFRSAQHLKISLPPGSYVPEITHLEEAAPTEPPAPQTPARTGEIEEAKAVPSSTRRLINNRWFLLIAVVAVAGLVMIAILGRSSASANASQAQALPWSAFFHQTHTTVLVTSDPNIAEIAGLTKTPITLSDYANQRYIPDGAKLSPEIIDFCRFILRGDKAANVDSPVLVSIAELAGKNSAQINVRAARDLRFSDLDTDNSFIFLGSPRTDPWTGLFDDQLDFRFYYDPKLGQEIVTNARPQHGEPNQYIPTAKGLATGQSFATISFVRNQNHAGNVLILAGANAEGTKAAGELALNSQALSSSLQQCGIGSSESVQHFQLLLHVNMMAGSPGNFDVLACHRLP